MMKKLLLFFSTVSLTVLLGGCADNNIADAPPSTPLAISFSTYMSSASRGIDATTATLQSDGFKVQGRLATSGDSFMDERSVSYSNGWSYSDDLMYWPDSDNIDFFAYSTDITSFVFSSTDDPTFEYQTESEGASQIDAILAYNANEGGDNGVVTLIFQHALSKITTQVTANSEDENLTLYIYDITYDDIYTEGICSVDDLVSITWDDFDTTADISLDLLESVTDDGIAGSDDPAATDVTDAADDLIIIPQTLGVVTIKGEWKQGSVVVENFSSEGKSVDLSKTLVADTHYTINFLLSPNVMAISFIATVEDWEEDDEDDRDLDDDDDDN